MANRIEKIKKKFGANAFKRWGASGGNPILNAIHKGYKVKVVK